MMPDETSPLIKTFAKFGKLYELGGRRIATIVRLGLRQGGHATFVFP